MADPVNSPAVASDRLPGPYPVGNYAHALRDRLRGLARVGLEGEVWGLRPGRARVYFELRDSRGALPCSMWRDDYERLPVTPVDGQRVVVGGGCDLYPGSSTSSPSFSFAVSELRLAGEGDLLAALARLRRELHADGLFEPQKQLPRPPLPRTVGVVTGRGGKARADVLAGLERRGWGGRLVWAFAPVQDRHAAPAVSAALRDLAAVPQVEVIIVARGGGSLADLFAFCDESLCRTVALLRVPVISSVGHHTDRTLLDDVAAVSCSTPTHAAEAAVPLDCRAARSALASAASNLRQHSRRAVVSRAQALTQLTRAPVHHLERQRRGLSGLARELEATSRRQVRAQTDALGTQAETLQRARGRLLTAGAAGRRHDLGRLELALSANDPQRALARGYAMVEDSDNEALTSAAAARNAEWLRLRFHDGESQARVVVSDDD